VRWDCRQTYFPSCLFHGRALHVSRGGERKTRMLHLARGYIIRGCPFRFGSLLFAWIVVGKKRWMWHCFVLSFAQDEQSLQINVCICKGFVNCSLDSLIRFPFLPSRESVLHDHRCGMLLHGLDDAVPVKRAETFDGVEHSKFSSCLARLLSDDMHMFESDCLAADRAEGEGGQVPLPSRRSISKVECIAVHTDTHSSLDTTFQ
jgi:hypothetical protein